MTVAGESYKLGGDIIVAVDGGPVHDLAGLRDAVAMMKPGDTITLTIYRGSEKLTVKSSLDGGLPLPPGSRPFRPR